VSETRVDTHVRADGSTSRTTWTKTEWFCVGCGCQEVWEDDCDDYYEGTDFRCAVCDASFRHPIVGGATR
jgi:hypothetical protein